MASPARELSRSRHGRLAVLASCAVHASALAVLAATAPAPGGVPSRREAAPRRPEVTAPTVTRRQPPVEVEVVAAQRSVWPGVQSEGAAGGSAPARAVRGRVRRPSRPVEAPLVAAVAVLAPAPAVHDGGEGAVEIAAPEAEPLPVAPAESAEPAAAGSTAGSGTGQAAGPGPGPGAGDEGTGAEGRLRRDLRARVIGDPAAEQRQREGRPPFISNREATALRTRDFFPRLPEAWWQRRGPYVVALDICVSADGAVTDAELRSSAAPALDAIVRDAVTTWRYRARLVGGAPAPFCHGVIIKYERW